MERLSSSIASLIRHVSAVGLCAMASMVQGGMSSPANALAFALCFPASEFEAQARTVGLLAKSEHDPAVLTLVDKSGRRFVNLRIRPIAKGWQSFGLELPSLEPFEVEANAVMALFVAVREQSDATGFALQFLGLEQGVEVGIGVVNGQAAPWETAARGERVREMTPKEFERNREPRQRSLVHTRQMVEHARLQGTMKPLFDKN